MVTSRPHGDQLQLKAYAGTDPATKAGRKPSLVRWCVRHRDGWCAAEVNRPFREGTDWVPTRCGYGVCLPGGNERREPDCPECLETLKR